MLAVAGRGEADRFISVGLPDNIPCGGGPPPEGHGLLGVALREGRPMRLDDLTRHPRSVGFPDGHPVMRSLLAVPIVARGAVLGNLYLAEKAGGVLMTNSGKFAHYAPGNTGYDVVYGALRDCVESAVAGRPQIAETVL